MGLSNSTKTTTSTNTVKPVYEGQLLGVNTGLQGAFDRNQGNLDNIQSQLSGLMPNAVANYANNPTLGAANNYVQRTLDSEYSPNGLLDNVLKYSNADVANGTNAALGTRGLSGGSVAAKIIAGQLAKNDAGMRTFRPTTPLSAPSPRADCLASIPQATASPLKRKAAAFCRRLARLHRLPQSHCQTFA